MEEKLIEVDEMSPVDPNLIKLPMPQASEYKVGHHKIPLPLLFLYILVFLWATISWIPFAGY